MRAGPFRLAPKRRPPRGGGNNEKGENMMIVPLAEKVKRDQEEAEWWRDAAERSHKSHLALCEKYSALTRYLRLMISYREPPEDDKFASAEDELEHWRCRAESLLARLEPKGEQR